MVTFLTWNYGLFSKYLSECEFMRKIYEKKILNLYPVENFCFPKQFDIYMYIYFLNFDAKIFRLFSVSYLVFWTSITSHVK